MAAAGNSAGTSPGYPAAFSAELTNVLSVGAHDSADARASFSNLVGASGAVQVDAPGVGIYSSLPGNRYGRYNGTSMATPHVAGLAALVLSANPGLAPAAVRSLIVEGADRAIAGSDSMGGVNAALTVARAEGYTGAVAGQAGLASTASSGWGESIIAAAGSLSASAAPAGSTSPQPWRILADDEARPTPPLSRAEVALAVLDEPIARAAEGVSDSAGRAAGADEEFFAWGPGPAAGWVLDDLLAELGDRGDDALELALFADFFDVAELDCAMSSGRQRRCLQSGSSLNSKPKVTATQTMPAPSARR